MAQINGAEGGLEVDINEQVAQGQYANLAIISHSTTEFIIDFAAKLPAMPKAKVNSRVILTPEHAKRLLYSLQENVARYESNNGVIELHHREKQPINLTPMGEA